MKRAILSLLIFGGCGTAFVEGTDVAAFTTDAGIKTDSSAARDDGGGLGCTVQTCEDLGWQCGHGDNGCSHILACKPCNAPSQCTSEHKCKCQAATCASLGVECGTFPDGCGGSDLNCGSSCPTGQQCNKGKCEAKPCTPVVSCARGQCGALSNGCGGVLDCGNCQSPESCGGKAIANQCGCTPKTKGDACGARQCSKVSDGCGGTIDCGTCQAGTTCDASYACTACVPTTTCARLGYGCGIFVDDCHKVQDCGEKPKCMTSSTAAASLCSAVYTAGFKYPHVCDCVEKKTCTSAPYAGVPPTWNCVAGSSATTGAMNGRFCCKEMHP